jgi:hypothetical protein
MLRHSAGFALANKGTDTLQAYLGLRSIQSTVRYTELALGGLGTFGGKVNVSQWSCNCRTMVTFASERCSEPAREVDHGVF